jgi:2-iminoacetate synthase ThiH
VRSGIHPDFTGQTYLDILAAAKAGAPDIHVHAFSPLEVTHVRQPTFVLCVEEFLLRATMHITKRQQVTDACKLYLLVYDVCGVTSAKKHT